MEEVPEVSQTPRGGRKTYPSDLADPTGGGWARRCAAGGLSWKIRSCPRKIAISLHAEHILVHYYSDTFRRTQMYLKEIMGG